MLQDRRYCLNDFDFNLSEELIAKYPLPERDESRLFVLNRKTQEFKHIKFYEISEFINSGDVLVLNNAKVLPARIYFKRESGARVEIVLANRISYNRWLVISNRTSRLSEGERIYSEISERVFIKIIKRVNDFLEVETSEEFNDILLNKIGEIPLPPYIKREASEIDKQRYQTVYASQGMAAAAPTAGLHFSQKVIDELSNKKVEFVYVTLDVSWGTFQPVRENDLMQHKMHAEHFILSEESAAKINNARKNERKIIAIGTTSLRVLEATYVNGENIPCDGETNIFIYPPQKILSANMLLTNFHTPKSTLLMLVCAFAGYDTIMNAYQTAIDMQYRFFSYGDAMLIL